MLCAYTRPMQISGERLQDHWSSGFTVWRKSNEMWVHHSNHIIKTRGNGLLNSLLKQQSVKLLIVSVLLKLQR